MDPERLQARLYNCYLYSAAAYAKRPCGFMLRKADEGCYLARAKVRGWHMVLLDTGQGLAVAFRGSRTRGVWNIIKDKARNLAIHLLRPRSTLKAMEAQLKTWQDKYGDIRLLTGHSEGGYFATHLWRKLPDIWHVTFNGHKAKRGPFHINLRTKSDPVSKVFGVADRYFTVGKGKHPLKDFKKYLWKERHLKVWESFLADRVRAKLVERMQQDSLWA